MSNILTIERARNIMSTSLTVWSENAVKLNLKQLRLSAGLTQEDVAKVISISRSTVAMWESDDALPRTDKLPMLATLYHCTIDELLRDRSDTEIIPDGEAV